MLGSVLLVGSVLIAQADVSEVSAANDGLSVEVRRLARQLHAPSLAQRDAAEKALVSLGAEVLDLLPQVTNRTPAEVRLRLGRIRQKLQQAAAEAATRASLITLRGEAMPLSKILAALQEQSGNSITDFRQKFGHPITNPSLTVNFQDTPFWQALDQVLDQAELTVYPFGQEKAVSVVGRQEQQRTRGEGVGYSGPFRFEPIRIVAQRDLRSAAGSLRLTLSVQWEPRLAPVSLKQPINELTAVDQNGNPLAIEGGRAVLEVPTGGATAVELDIPLALPDRDITEIASLKGKLTAIVPGKVETFRFGDLVDEQNVGARNVEQRVAGVTVTVDRVRRNGAIWEVRMRVRFDEAAGALQSHRSWIFDNEAYLEGPDGEQISYDAMETTRQAKNEVGVAYGFVLDDPPAEHTFVYKTPGAIMASKCEYEIKNVPLP